MTTGIYLIKNKINNKAYVGQSTNIERRYKNHIYNLRNGNHCNYELQYDFDTLGEDVFEMNVLHECENSNLDKMESYYATLYDVWRFGYNLAPITDYSILNYNDISCNKLDKYINDLVKKAKEKGVNKGYLYSIKDIARTIDIEFKKLKLILKENFKKGAYEFESIDINYCGTSSTLSIDYIKED